MTRTDAPTEGLLHELNQAGPGEVVPALLAELDRTIGATSVRLLFADVEERVLNVWGQAGERVPLLQSKEQIEGSIHGRVYLTGRPERGELGGRPVVVAPVVAKSEHIGVLEVLLRAPIDDHAEAEVSAVAMLVGYVSIAGDHWTDEFHVVRRRQDMSLAAEYQWALLPLAAFATSRVSLAGALEPAYDIAGDAFDYSCGTQYLHVGIFDAMGHGLAAARLSALAVTAFRNARRSGQDLEGQAGFIHRNLEEVSGLNGFVTGQLLQIDLEDPGKSWIVNAGHPVPFLQRRDGALRRPELEVDFPFGLPFDGPPAAQHLELGQGDRLTLFSDGVIEARPHEGQPFSEARLARELVERRRMPPRETARTIIGAVREHRAAELQDDASILVVDLLTS